MRKKIIAILFVLTGLKTYSQFDGNSYVGLNLFQLPASTINVNYSVDLKPYFTPVADLGYTFKYDSNLDLIGFFLTPHSKSNNDGYDIEKQSGGYFKLGGFVNLRKDFVKNNFFRLGLFITNSIIHEEGTYMPFYDSGSDPFAYDIEHNVYLSGLSTSLGYEFKMTDKLRAGTDFQLSFPTNKYLDLYGYRNFIPGIGFKDFEGKWFPMVILNLKYMLK